MSACHPFRPISTSSPIRLTELGDTEWAEAKSVRLVERHRGRNAYEIQQKCFAYPKRVDTLSGAMTDTLIERNPEILGGTPVFAGTRVPVRILMEHLEAGDRLDDFLNDFPSVTREQAVSLLEHATAMVVSGSIEAVA